MDRLTNLRLAEALTQNGIVSREEMSEAIAAQEASNEPFYEILILSGYVTEWDLAKLVSEQFQLPFLHVDRYECQEEVVKSLEENFLFQHLILPLDKFGAVMTVSLPVFVPGEILDKIQTDKDVEIYPVVGLSTANKKRLYEIYPDHPKEKKKTVHAGVPGGKSKEWESIFDLGDEAVKKELGS